MPKRRNRKIIATILHFKTNEIVFAHIRGYKPWPSQILEVFNVTKKYRVKFFGQEGGEQIVRHSELSKIGPIDDNPIAKKYIHNEPFSEAWDYCRNLLIILRASDVLAGPPLPPIPAIAGPSLPPMPAIAGLGPSRVVAQNGKIGNPQPRTKRQLAIAEAAPSNVCVVLP